MKYETLKIFVGKIETVEQGLTEKQALYWVRQQNDTLKHPDWVASMRRDSREKLNEVVCKMNNGFLE